MVYMHIFLLYPFDVFVYDSHLVIFCFNASLTIKVIGP